VIALWRLLAGLPAAILWWVVVGIALTLLAGASQALIAVALAAALTLAGLLAWRPWRMASTAIRNAMLVPKLRPAICVLREETVRWYASR
jgi:hypothetical protein